MPRRPAGRSLASLVLTPLLVAGCGGMPSSTPSPSVASSAPSSTSSAGPTSSAPTSAKPTAKPTGKPTSSSPSRPTSAATPSCADLAGSLSRSEQVGQLFMVAVDSGGMSITTARMLDREHVGSVILLGNSTAGADAVRRLTDQVRAAIDAPKGTKTLLAGDQEGGQVQRFAGSGFDTIPAAADQADLSDATLRTRAKTWGQQLRRAGIDADLAPVADVVPTSIGTRNQPIGALRRGYGPDAGTVADKVGAFVDGMDAAGVATSVKHFPGLGRVTGNTDFETNVVDATTTRHDRDLAGFRRGVQRGVDMVMVSSATYTKIDSGGPATFSATVITGMIRGDLGFDGVVISDDLAGKALTVYGPGHRAIAFVEAGGDLAIMGDRAQAATMIDAVRAKAADDPAFAAQVTAAAGRVLALKARRGLASCAP